MIVAGKPAIEIPEIKLVNPVKKKKNCLRNLYEHFS